MILQSLWKRAGDRWFSTNEARIVFGAAAGLILAVTAVLWRGTPKNPAPAVNVGLGVLGVLAGLSIFFLWSGMWRYWIRCDSSRLLVRRIWFFVMLVGFWYGAVLYYICVYLPRTTTRRQQGVAG